MASNKDKISLWVDQDLLHKISEEAAINGISKSQVVNSHLQSAYLTYEYLAKHKLVEGLKLFEELETEQRLRKLYSLHYFFRSMEDISVVQEFKELLKNE